MPRIIPPTLFCKNCDVVLSNRIELARIVVLLHYYLLQSLNRLHRMFCLNIYTNVQLIHKFVMVTACSHYSRALFFSRCFLIGNLHCNRENATMCVKLCVFVLAFSPFSNFQTDIPLYKRYFEFRLPVKLLNRKDKQ